MIPSSGFDAVRVPKPRRDRFPAHGRGAPVYNGRRRLIGWAGVKLIRYVPAEPHRAHYIVAGVAGASLAAGGPRTIAAKRVGQLWRLHTFPWEPPKIILTLAKFRGCDFGLGISSTTRSLDTAHQGHSRPDKMATELTVQSERAFLKQPHSEFPLEAAFWAVCEEMIPR